ncbi:MAG: EAL domain-containing protein [Nitrosomonadales bacterium]|nr:MAG: EAL domain-containing protein [Nitrosomonadales bacterium]
MSQKRLRTKAEAQLLLDTAKQAAARPAEELLHELQVHEIELEMQNEELRRAQIALEESRDRYVDLYDFGPVGYLTLTRKGLISDVNLTAAALLGVERSKLQQRRFAPFVAPEDSDRWHRRFLHMLQHGEQQSCELALQRQDGTLLHVCLHCLKAGSDASPVLRMALTDITERKRVERDLYLSHAAINKSRNAYFWVSPQGQVTYVNDYACLSLGYSREELIGLHVWDFNPDYSAEAQSQVWADIKQQGMYVLGTHHRRKDGTIFPVEVIANYIASDGEELVFCSVHDVTERNATEEKIRDLAFFDPLTKLPNRRLLIDRLQHALTASARSAWVGALLFIDLDNFKTLNDTLGHDIGDLLLQQVADRLTLCVREGDTLARLGGDEFVVILEDLGDKDIEAAARTEAIGEKIITALTQPYQLGSHEHHSTPSIGVTLFNDHERKVKELKRHGAALFNDQEQEAKELLKQADIAMYQAKKSGRNTLRFFDPQMQHTIDIRAALEVELRKALDNRQFHLYYQIQVDSSSHPLGAEALIRWQHPEHGLVSPAAFIPLAEEIGMIIPIGQWVLETACAQIKKWEDSTHTRGLQLAINVSAQQFQQVDFVEQVHQALSRNAIKPDRLKLELTESLVLHDIDDTIYKMNALREIGVRFSMDDFGTGHSSLSSLKKLPLDQLKIDQSFVRDISNNPDDTVIVQTIIAMGNNMGMEVIAEGVETDAQRTFLEQHGCFAYQGYLFSKPVPLEEFEQLLNAVEQKVT